MKRCLRCGGPITDEVGEYKRRKRHPECAEAEKREWARRHAEQKRQRTLRERAKQLAQPQGLATRKPRWVLPAPRNPRGCQAVDEIIRRVDAGTTRDDDARAQAAFERMAREYGAAS